MYCNCINHFTIRVHVCHGKCEKWHVEYRPKAECAARLSEGDGSIRMILRFTMMWCRKIICFCWAQPLFVNVVQQQLTSPLYPLLLMSDG